MIIGFRSIHRFRRSFGAVGWCVVASAIATILAQVPLVVLWNGIRHGDPSIGEVLNAALVLAGVEAAILVLAFSWVGKQRDRAEPRTDADVAAEAPPLMSAESATAFAEARLAKRHAELGDIFEIFSADIARRLDDVCRASVTLNGTADDLSRAALRITSETTAVSVTAEDVNRKVDSAAVSGREFLGTISRIGDYASQSARMGHQAVALTQTTTATIDELISMSDKIGAMSQLIVSIARQTNLLALNATIEAARAGELGRGFAVVAGEVKVLASETEKAVRVISESTAAIKGSTARSVAAVREISASIQGLNRATADIADAVEERVNAAATIAERVDDAAADVGYLTSAIGKIERVVDETVQGAGFLRATAVEIVDHSAAIRRDLQAFSARLTAGAAVLAPSAPA